MDTSLVTYKTTGSGCNTYDSVSEMGDTHFVDDSGYTECDLTGAALHIQAENAESYCEREARQ